MLDKEYISKDRIEDVIVEAGEGVVYVDNSKFDDIPRERINCMSFVNLVKIQYERFPNFYMEYRRDGRVRVYNYNYPLNFQLSHLVRNTINIEPITSATFEIVKNFLKLDIWKYINKRALEITIFFWQKLDIKLINSISKKFNITYINEGSDVQIISNNLKLEAVLILLESLVPKKIILIKERILWIFEKIDKILNLDLTDVIMIDEIFKILCIKNKKMHVIKNIYILQKIYKENI